jgi:hypothetical protein
VPTDASVDLANARKQLGKQDKPSRQDQVKVATNRRSSFA